MFAYIVSTNSEQQKLVHEKDSYIARLTNKLHSVQAQIANSELVMYCITV